jgi:3-oxoacyl-(acyl-carrier-protein) synthase
MRQWQQCHDRCLQLHPPWHCVAVVTGGSEAAIYEAGVGGFNALHAMSTRNDDPATASRPYDKDRDGFVLGEGGAAIILEDLEHALGTRCEDLRRGDRWGHEQRCLPHHRPHPEGLGAELCMKHALKDAGFAPPRHRLHQHPRNQHPHRRSAGGEGDPTLVR